MEHTSSPIEAVIRHYASRYRGRIIFGLVLFLAVWVGVSVFYSVEADSEGVVLRFGKYSDTTLPGLHTKWPWRIVDPMKFFQAVRTENRGYKILDDLVDSAVRDVVARNNLIEVVRSSNRELLYESDELARDAASSQDRITLGRAKMEAEILTVASVGLKEQYGMELPPRTAGDELLRPGELHRLRQRLRKGMIGRRSQPVQTERKPDATA